MVVMLLLLYQTVHLLLQVDADAGVEAEKAQSGTLGVLDVSGGQKQEQEQEQEQEQMMTKVLKVVADAGVSQAKSLASRAGSQAKDGSWAVLQNINKFIFN